LQRKPDDIQDVIVTDTKHSSTSEEVSTKQEQSGYMDMLEIIDDLKQSAEK